MFIEAQQSRSKDTVISELETRIKGFEWSLKRMEFIDSVRISGYRRDSTYAAQQQQKALDEVASKNRQLKWQKTKADIFGTTTIASIVYIAVKIFFK